MEQRAKVMGKTEVVAIAKRAKEQLKKARKSGKYKITKKNLRLLIPLKPYKLLTPQQVADINKKLNSPIRKAKKRKHYLETKKIQEKLKHGEQLSSINQQRAERSKRGRVNK